MKSARFLLTVAASSVAFAATVTHAAAGPDPQITSRALPVAPGQIGFGVSTASGFYDLGPVAALERAVGRKADLVQTFVGWQYAEGEPWNEFPTWRVKDVIAHGSTPEITWNPTITGGAPDDPSMNLGSILGGAHDAYILRFAKAARDVRHPILIRFGHEMNGIWASYSEGRSGNRPGDFAKAWRYVHDLFQRAGAANVEWNWSPNIVMPGSPSLRTLYPGDDYVDWVGIDGYSYPKEGCRSPSQLFDPVLADIVTFSSRPVMLAEVAVASECGRKSEWIDELFEWLDRHQRVRSLTWWNRAEAGRDWRIDSSTASAAMARGLAAQPALSAPSTPELRASPPASGAVYPGVMAPTPITEPQQDPGPVVTVSPDGPSASPLRLPADSTLVGGPGAPVEPGASDDDDPRMPSEHLLPAGLEAASAPVARARAACIRPITVRFTRRGAAVVVAAGGRRLTLRRGGDWVGNTALRQGQGSTATSAVLMKVRVTSSGTVKMTLTALRRGAGTAVVRFAGRRLELRSNKPRAFKVLPAGDRGELASVTLCGTER